MPKLISVNYKLLKQYIQALSPLILMLLAVGSFVFYSANFIDGKFLKDTLTVSEPIFLFVNFSLIIILFLANFKEIKKQFKNVKKYSWIFLIAVFFLGFILRMYIAPHTHKVFFDEDIYLDTSKEILARGKGSLCNYGDANGCYEYDLMKWPNGYPFVLTIPFLIFGISETVAFNFTALLGSLSVVIIFFIGYLFSKNEKIALFSALLFALIPVHIMWSGTTASEPILVFFTLLSIFFFMLSFKIQKMRMNALALMVLSYAMQIKIEGGMLLPLIAFIILLFDMNWVKKLRNYRFLLLWILFFILITPYLIHSYYFSKYDPWGAEGKKFGLEYLQKNMSDNVGFWIAGYPSIEHPFLFTIFALVGLIYSFKKYRKTCLFLLIWFGSFFLLYAFFYAGSVRYGVDVRYALSEYPPLILFAGYGIFAITRVISQKSKMRFNENSVAILLAIFILFSFYFYLPSISTPADKIQESYGARHYHDFVVNNAEKLDDSCCILSHVPSIFLTINKCSLQTWNGQNEVRMKELFSKTDCVVFDDGYWCTLPPYKESVCKSMFDKFKLEVINRFNDTVEQREYTLYKVLKPAE